jgi:hypothetical protein
MSEQVVNETRYATLNLSDLRSDKRFATGLLIRAICTKAVSQLSNSSMLLSQLVSHFSPPKEWVRRLLELPRET